MAHTPSFLVINKPYTNCLSVKKKILITIMFLIINFLFLI